MIYSQWPHPATTRNGEVVMTSLCTSEQRHSYLSNETPNDVSTERRQDVSVVRLHDVFFEYLKGKDFFKISGWKSCFYVKSVWFVNNKCRSFDKFE